MKTIKYLIMDVDGTLTDGKIYMGESGELFKAFDIKDGYGIHDILIPNGISPVIITGRKSNIVMKRCSELGIEKVFQGVKDKLETMRSFISDYSTVAYIGDDLNDLQPIKLVKEKGGITGCPSDAANQIKEIVDFTSSYAGGSGAVREFIEFIMK